MGKGRKSENDEKPIANGDVNANIDLGVTYSNVDFKAWYNDINSKRDFAGFSFYKPTKENCSLLLVENFLPEEFVGIMYLKCDLDKNTFSPLFVFGGMIDQKKHFACTYDTNNRLNINGLVYRSGLDKNYKTVGSNKYKRRKFSDFEFINKGLDFVFFGKTQLWALKTIMNENAECTLTGAQIEYGYTVRYKNDKKFYPTLKFETVGENQDGQLIPNIILGMPCPRYWGDDQKDYTLFSFLSVMGLHEQDSSMITPNGFLANAENIKNIEIAWDNFILRIKE